jgi:ABC-2 type transport system ATP-binding protein
MIEVTELSKAYGATVAIDRISFTARPGRVTALLGPNGAGKTTTLRILLGLSRADRGTATIGGVRYQAIREPHRVVGALLEWDTFHPARSGRTHRALPELWPPATSRVIFGLALKLRESRPRRRC